MTKTSTAQATKCPTNETALRAELDAAKRALAELQAKIDRLMLEYCPDEMSAEQVANWGAHQRAAPSELEIDVTAALAAKSTEQKEEK